MQIQQADGFESEEAQAAQRETVVSASRPLVTDALVGLCIEFKPPGCRCSLLIARATPYSCCFSFRQSLDRSQRFGLAMFSCSLVQEAIVSRSLVHGRAPSLLPSS